VQEAFSAAFGPGSPFAATFGPGGTFSSFFGARGGSSSSFEAEEIIPPAQERDLEESFEATAPLPEGGRVRLMDAHGGVSLEGGDVDEVQVRVLKRVRALDPELARRLLQEFQIGVTQEGEELVIGSSRPKRHDDGWQNRVQGMWAYYRIIVPRRAGAAVTFQHGKVRVSGLDGPVELKGAHGDWGARDLAGPVRLKHEHGAVQAANLGANLEVAKSHGPLALTCVGGDLALKAEHSSVRIEDVRGAADLAGGHGGWEVQQIAGSIRFKHEHGPVRLANVGAEVEADKRHGPLEIDGMEGNLRLRSEHGNRTIRNVSGQAEIRHSHGNLELLGLGGGLLLEGGHAHVKVEFAGPLAGNVAIRLGHGRASVRLSRGSSARIDLSTSHGHLTAPGLTVVEKGRHSMRMQGTLGAGEHAVTIEGGHSSFSLTCDDLPGAAGEGDQ
jgi:hypothetical protein